MSSNLIGKRLDGYEIIRVLGRGGMGVVYKAHEMTLQRVVALKVLPQHLAENKEFITRFYREARAAAQLNHMNVVTIHRVGEDEGHHYIAMEYLKGRELTDIIKERKQIDVKEAVDVARQVASALAAAHELGILHRDIKPHNVMLDEAGRVKVMDFGIAKLNEPGDGTHGITMTGQLLGTPAYMSPEQCKGTNADARSDIYSLGVVLYQAIAGKVPYTGETPLAVMRKIVEEPLPDITTVVPGVPEAVVQILNRALNKDPNQRYNTALEMEEDCKRFLGGQEIKIQMKTETSGGLLPISENVTQATLAPPAKSRTPVALVAAVCLVAMLGVGGFTFMKLQERRKNAGSDGTENNGGIGGTEIAGVGTPAVIAPVLSPSPEPPKPTDAPTLTPKPEPTSSPIPTDSPRPNRKPNARIQLSAAKLDPGQELTVSFNATDPDEDRVELDYRLNGSVWIPLSSSEMAKSEFAPSGFKDGENVIEFRARDDKKESAIVREKFVVAAAMKPVIPVVPKVQPSGQAGPIGEPLRGHTNNISAVAVSGDGQTAISGGQDGQAIVWSMKSGEKLATLTGHAQEVSTVALSADGKTALTGGKDATVRVWSVAGGKQALSFENHDTKIIAAIFTPDGKSALSASDDGLICKWDVASGSEAFRVPTSKVNAVGFSANGKLAITGNANGNLQLWDIEARSLRAPFPQDVAKGIGHSRAIFSVALSADGRRALSAGLDQKICLWDGERAQLLRTFEGHKGGTQSVAFSSDAAYAISGGKDKAVTLWDVDTGESVQSWFSHTGSTLAVAIAPGSSTAVSGSADQTVRRWRW